MAIGAVAVSSGFASTSDVVLPVRPQTDYSVAIGYYAKATGLDAYAFGLVGGSCS
ncbi:MAG: hypothetical protein MZV64_29995 [Ignavibacteriales bacterium]|nr:hypothetical protein [Ignavibacteriales bacterium]